MGQVARTGTDIQNARAWMQKIDQILACMSVHMWCRNGCAITDRLWRVRIRARWGIVCTIDLDIVIQLSARPKRNNEVVYCENNGRTIINKTKMTLYVNCSLA